MYDYKEINIGKIDAVIRCKRCCRKIKNGLEFTKKHGHYHKVCYEKEKDNLNVKELIELIEKDPPPPPEKKTKIITFD